MDARARASFLAADREPGRERQHHDVDPLVRHEKIVERANRARVGGPVLRVDYLSTSDHVVDEEQPVRTSPPQYLFVVVAVVGLSASIKMKSFVSPADSARSVSSAGAILSVIRFATLTFCR